MEADIGKSRARCGGVAMTALAIRCCLAGMGADVQRREGMDCAQSCVFVPFI